MSSAVRTTPCATRKATAPAAPRSAVVVVVVGGAGLTGGELVRVLWHHPAVRIAAGTSRQHAGQRLDAVDLALPPLELVHPTQVDFTGVDLAFTCLPHDASGAFVANLFDAGVRVIDLSGAHRLRSVASHERVYACPRKARVMEHVVYGLPELFSNRLQSARVVANPGCYATAVSLALGPLAEVGLLGDPIVVDAKSGVSGAGRSATATTHFCSVTGDIRPYKLGREHRHVPEIEEVLAELANVEAGAETRLIFTPHLVPVERGIEATIVCPTRAATAGELRALYRRRYARHPFVHVLPLGEPARIRAVARTNRAVLGVHPVARLDAVILTVAIDNLLKGAAGQAVQNMNLMLGLPETAGLKHWQ